MKFQLAPYVNVGYSEKGLDLGYGSIQTQIKDEFLQNLAIEACLYLKSPRTKEELKNHLLLSSDATEDQLHTIFSILENKNLIIKSDTYNCDDRFSRNALFYNMLGVNPEHVQNILKDKHVVIQGCGGIGNIAGVLLATSGIGKLTLIDDDEIELSNLTRQIMFTENHVGMMKTDILKEELKTRMSSLEVDVINQSPDTQEAFNLLPQSDLIIVSGDSPNICNYVNRFCHRKTIPFINVGYIQDIAAWGPLVIPGETPCYECFSKYNITNENTESIFDEKIKRINEGYQAPSFGPINMISAAFSVIDMIKYLGGMSGIHALGKRVGIWTNNLTFEYQTYKRLSSCTICKSSIEVY